MSRLKKLMITLLTIAMSLSLTPAQTDAAAKVRLSRDTLLLNVGKTATLSLKNSKKTVTWSSSRNSVATVSRNGYVKAKKQGSCNITAKSGGKKYVCKVTVKKKANAKKSVTYVYITETGSKYHRANCRYLWNSKIKISKSSAKKNYTPCSVCNP